MSTAAAFRALEETPEARRRRLRRRGIRFCARCLCTDAEACDGGCWWVGPALCSACEGPGGGLRADDGKG